METPKLTVVVFSVFAMVLTTSYVQPAYAASHAAKRRHTSHTQSGLIDTTKNGQGTYTVTKTRNCSSTTVTKTEDFANGTTITSTNVITKDPNGAKTMDITTNYGNGKVTNMDETVSSKGAITGTYTQANGKVDAVSGEKEKTSYGYVTDLTLTNAKGQTESIDTELLKSSDASAWVVSGTSFNGKAINGAGLQTTNTAPNTNTVDTTVNGRGTYATYESNGTIYTGRTFENNASLAASNTITNNPNGTTSYDRVNDSVSPTGVQSSSNVQTTYSSNGNGSDNITGTFTQSNGHNGTVAGSDSVTNYGYSNNLTYTDQNGLTKIQPNQYPGGW